MKKSYFLIVFVNLILIATSIFAADAAPVLPDGFSLVKMFEWVSTNWVSIALILSEVAALLSEKWSGILKAVINILAAVFTKKKDLKS